MEYKQTNLLEEEGFKSFPWTWPKIETILLGQGLWNKNLTICYIANLENNLIPYWFNANLSCYQISSYSVRSFSITTAFSQSSRLLGQRLEEGCFFFVRNLLYLLRKIKAGNRIHKLEGTQIYSQSSFVAGA